MTGNRFWLFWQRRGAGSIPAFYANDVAEGTSDLESKRSAVYCFTNETKSTFVQAFPEALL